MAPEPTGQEPTATNNAPRVTVEAQLETIRNQLTKIENSKPDKVFVAIVVALIAGILSLGEVLLESRLAGKSAFRAKTGEKIAEKIADFYLDVPVELQAADSLFAEYCSFDAFSRGKELDKALSAIYKRSSTAPQPVNEDIRLKLSAYDDLVAEGLVDLSKKDDACRKAPALHAEILGLVKRAMQEL
jgi:hypothetical protein